AQDLTATAEVGFDLVERGFFFPALVICPGQIHGGDVMGIGDGGDNDDQIAVGISVRTRVLNHPYQSGHLGGNVLACAGLVGQSCPAGRAEAGGVDQCVVGAVGQ